MITQKNLHEIVVPFFDMLVSISSVRLSCPTRRSTPIIQSLTSLVSQSYSLTHALEGGISPQANLTAFVEHYSLNDVYEHTVHE